MKIGQGGYGKIYRPYPIQCQSTKYLIPKQDYIGKISHTSDISKSKMNKIQTFRKKIDPQNNFTLSYLGFCQKNNSNKTKLIWQKNKFNIEYLFKYGGITLDIDQCDNFLENLYELCIDIAIMNQNGYSHLDIKDENILCLPDSGKLYLIDFDLSLPTKDIYKVFYQEQEYEDTIYYVWPPEINFGLNFRGKRLKPYKRVPSQLKFLIDSNVFTKNDLLEHINAYINSTSYSEFYDGNSVYKSTYDFSKTDIYSIGILLKTLIKNPKSNLKKLIDQTIEPIPEQRISWFEFLEQFKKIIYKKVEKNPILIKKSFTV